MEILADVAVLVATIGLIAFSCESFTNAIEWVGKLFGLKEGAVGSILAAIGTALPETIIPLIAIFSAWMVRGSPHEALARVAIGEGVIIGAPFMLSTLAMFVTGVAVVVFVRHGARSENLDVDPGVILRDLATFLVAYCAAIAASFLPERAVIGPLTLKSLCGFGFPAIYLWYFLRTLTAPGKLGSDLEPLHFARRHQIPPLNRVLLQMLVALVAMLLGAHFFVGRMIDLSSRLGAGPLVLSLLVTPIATELPEKLNSIIWIRVKKDTLALGNITGAMVFQACIPVAIGLWFTSWHLEPQALLSAGLTIGCSAFLLVWTAWGRKLSLFALLFGGLFYAAFLLALALWRFS